MPTQSPYQITGRTARAIAQSIESAIHGGHLRGDERLPAIRDLAESLGTSAGTVAGAYRELRERGLLQTDGRRGTSVAPLPGAAGIGAAAAVPAGAIDLRSGLPDSSLLPDLAPAFATAGEAEFVPTRLRERNSATLLAAAAERFKRDGIDPAHLAVVGGALDGIERTLAAELRPGDAVAIEDPSYPPIIGLVRALSLRPIPVAVDDEGPLPESLHSALDSGARAAVIVPRAQNPTGAALSEARTAELEALVAGRDVLVIEDDHAASVAGSTARTLSHRATHWATIRSVSKSLSPDLRLAVVAGDERTIARIESRQALGTGWVSTVLQRAVAWLWSDRRSEQLVDRAREAYAERRTGLIDALAARGIEAHGRSGINVWVPVERESVMVESLLAAGFAVAPGEGFRIRAAPGIRITLGNLRVEHVARLADAIADARTARAPRAY